MREPFGFNLHHDCAHCSLRGVDYFCDVPAASLKEIEAARFAMAFPTGSLLFVEGQQPKGFFILCKGRVRLTMGSRDGRTLTLRMIEAGETIGLPAAILGKPFESTAETLEPCQVTLIKREDLLRLLKQHPEIAMRAAQELSTGQRATAEQARLLGLSLSAAEKLARLLLEWASRGQKTEEGIRIHMTLTHEQIAELIGISRETVTRTLSDFRSRSLIAPRGAALVILDKIALEALAAN